MVTYYEWFFITICMIIVNESVLHFIMHSGELPIEKTPNLCGSSPALSVPSYDYDPNKLILGIHQSDSEGMFSENDTAFPSSSTPTSTSTQQSSFGNNGNHWANTLSTAILENS